MFIEKRTNNVKIMVSYVGDIDKVKIEYDDTNDKLTLADFDCNALGGVKLMYRKGLPFQLKSIVFSNCTHIEWSVYALIVANHFKLPKDVKIQFEDCQGDEERARYWL